PRPRRADARGPAVRDSRRRRARGGPPSRAHGPRAAPSRTLPQGRGGRATRGVPRRGTRPQSQTSLGHPRDRHGGPNMTAALPEHTRLILDGTKIAWHLDRVRAWERGERIAPITIDMALTRACNFACEYCYAMLQENDRKVITQRVIYDFLEDCAEIGVKGIILVSDGESSISPVFAATIQRGAELGISMAVGTNALALTKLRLEEILPHVTYLRVHIP